MNLVFLIPMKWVGTCDPYTKVIQCLYLSYNDFWLTVVSRRSVQGQLLWITLKRWTSLLPHFQRQTHIKRIQTNVHNFRNSTFNKSVSVWYWVWCCRKSCLDRICSNYPCLCGLPGFEPFLSSCGGHLQALFPFLLLLLLSVVEKGSTFHAGNELSCWNRVKHKVAFKA